MADQLIERVSNLHGRPGVSDAVAPAVSRSSQDSLRQARLCLESSGRRLKRPDVEQADEVLALLRKAADHLRQSINAG